MAKIRETVYQSKGAPSSSILGSTFVNRMNALYGFKTTGKGSGATEFEQRHGLKMVRVDLNNPNYRVKNAALGAVFENAPLSTNLEKLFDSYLSETSLSYSDVRERQERLDKLYFMYTNDGYIHRVVELCANEATMLGSETRLLTCESPNSAFTQRVYELFSQWGITQQRIHSTIAEIELYGEAFWAHKITLNGIERITPVKCNVVKERLEFDPMHMAEYLSQRDGWMSASHGRSEKLDRLVSMLSDEAEAMSNAADVADMYDTKLLGYELPDGIVIPPWAMTHFRYNPDFSEFKPYGRPPLLGCLAQFSQKFSTKILQGLARAMSFPVTLYKVKSTAGMTPEQAFAQVNLVRENYDNIGVTPASQGNEVYTVNTKIWCPSDLFDVDVKESKCDYDFMGDYDAYNAELAVDAGVPNAYFDKTKDGSMASGVSLIEQWKPFAHQVYSLQSCFIEQLGNMIRLHFAITGEFDYNTPFVLGLRFPAEETGEDHMNMKKGSLELTSSIIDLITSVLGLEDGDPLPEDVVTDILSKYSFLDPTEIQRWIRQSAFLKTVKDAQGGDSGSSGSSGSSSGGFDTQPDAGGLDLGGTDEGSPAGQEQTPASGSSAPSGTDAGMSEMQIIMGIRNPRLREAKRRKLREVKERYAASKDDIYFHFLESNHLTEFTNTSTKEHKVYIPKILSTSPMKEMFDVVSSGAGGQTNSAYRKLKEITTEDMLSHARDEKGAGNSFSASDLETMMSKGADGND